MTKAKRAMQEDIKLIDVIIELVDARIPRSSKNPDIDSLAQGKSRILLLNKSDMADAAKTQSWISYYEKQGFLALAVNSKKKNELKQVNALVQKACEKKIERDRKRGIKNRPVRAMIVGIPNVGKSTFINALIGKYVCLSQNMACTSKIHRIINKPFEDGFIDKYDHDLALAAGKEELLHNNESNRSDRIIVGTRFIGELCNDRIIVNDSPGVNFSRNYEHKSITEKIIKSRKFNLLIYIMNATQLGTNDESSHLEYVKKTIGRTPVLFLINKIDTFNIEEEDIEATIKRQIDFLKKKGFKNPMVCPVSSRAGYLAKRFMSTGLSRTEMRELYSLVDKFEQMNLPEYYAKAFKKISVPDSEKEEEQLLKTSGMSYVEKVIQVLTTGGNENGTDVR